MSDARRVGVGNCPESWHQCQCDSQVATSMASALVPRACVPGRSGLSAQPAGNTAIGRHVLSAAKIHTDDKPIRVLCVFR